MNKRYRYVIVCSNGSSHDLTQARSFDPFGLLATTRYDLPELLKRGWVPVRESPMGGAGQTQAAFALLVLEKEIEEPAQVEAVEE